MLISNTLAADQMLKDKSDNIQPTVRVLKTAGRSAGSPTELHLYNSKSPPDCRIKVGIRIYPILMAYLKGRKPNGAIEPISKPITTTIAASISITFATFANGSGIASSLSPHLSNQKISPQMTSETRIPIKVI